MKKTKTNIPQHERIIPAGYHCNQFSGLGLAVMPEEQCRKMKKRESSVRIRQFMLYLVKGHQLYTRAHTHTLIACTWHYSAKVNLKYNRSYSNFGLVGLLISFWMPKQLPVSVATK